MRRDERISTRAFTLMRLLLIVVVFASCAHAQVAVDFISRIAMSPNGHFVAILESGSGQVERVTLFRVADRQQLSTFVTRDFASLLDTPSIENMTWSADSSFLKIDITDGDLEHRVVLVQARRGSSLRPLHTEEGTVVAAAWAATGNKLFAIVSAGDPEDYPSGLVIIDADSGSATVVMDDRLVTAILDVSAERVLLKAPWDHKKKLPAAIIEILLPSLDRKVFLTSEGEATPKN